ncbi:MAG: Gfo/Idh/MocA family oxidoreductase [Planctomycetota bacterium]|nr:Gfo/Idh/MocA family oxidoreductase [Planctomycetota bacterium]
MRIALIGAGHMGAQHATAWAALDDVDVAWVVARGPERAGTLAEKLGATVSTDLASVLADSSLDAVDVTLPTALHAETTIRALEAGIHVLCETPLAATAAEAVRMRDVARASGRHLQVALLMRFARPAIDLHAEIERGELGALRELALARLAPGTGSDHHGDPLEELMLFDLDTLTRCMGTPSRVRAHIEPAPDGRSDRGRAKATLEYPDGARATCEASFLQPPSEPFVATMQARFERGRLDTTFRLPVDAWPTFELVRTREGEVEAPDTDLGLPPILEECRRFRDVVHGDGDAALLDATQAIKSLHVLDALRRSAQSGTWVPHHVEG